MSTLNVSNITDGTTTVGTSYVVNGSAKAWVQLNGITFAVADSFNVSSADDNGTGDYDINYTNSMNNNTYAVPAGCNGDGSGYNRAISINAVATGSHDIITFITDTANIKSDLDIITTAVFGDLA
jgi:hypothetical protein